VGHETDFTLCDFAADLRAPTPTAAAELATPITIDDLSAYLLGMGARLATSTLSLLAVNRNGLDTLSAGLRFYSPLRRIQTDRQRLDDFARRDASALKHRLALERSQLSGLELRIDALNPLAVLGRGYAVVIRQVDGEIVNKVAQAISGDALRIRVSDGEFDATVSQDKES
jgi:exodeoxyribonuclease VII large subunit